MCDERSHISLSYIEFADKSNAIGTINTNVKLRAEIVHVVLHLERLGPSLSVSSST